jgi:hypothetical protein
VQVVECYDPLRKGWTKMGSWYSGKSIEVCSDERAKYERDNPKCEYEIVNEVDYEL